MNLRVFFNGFNGIIRSYSYYLVGGGGGGAKGSGETGLSSRGGGGGGRRDRVKREEVSNKAAWF